MTYSGGVAVHLVDHPVAHTTLLALRDRSTSASRFRRLARRITLVLACEATRSLGTRPARVETPLEPAEGAVLDADVVVVPVLRAGMGMVDAVLDLIPGARVGHVGLQRDERTAIAHAYFNRLPPDLASSVVLLVDPMLATGGSAIGAIEMIKAAGGRTIRMICIVAAPEGLVALHAAHPDVDVYTPVVDRELDARKYIRPGLGDFGDRLYGTL